MLARLMREITDTWARARRDLARRGWAETAWRGSEEQYRLLFENNPHPMWVYDKETLAFLAVNDAAIAHYGYSREEFLGMTIKDIHPPEVVPGLVHVVAAVTGAYRRPGVWRQQKKDGALIDVEITTHDIGFGGRSGRLVLAADVTERKQAEEALRQSEAFNRSILNSLAAHIALVDTSGRIIAVNQAWEQFARENGDPAFTRTGPGINYLQVCERAVDSGDELAAEVLAGLRLVLNGLRPDFMLEYPCHSPTEQRWFTLYASAFSGESGGAVVSHQNITARKQIEAEVLRRNEALTTLNWIGQALAKLAEPDDIVELIYLTLGHVLNNDNLYIALYDEDKRYLAFPLYTVDGELRAPGGRSYDEHGLTEYVMRISAPLLISRDMDAVLAERGITPVGRPARSYMAAPMLAGEKVLGVIAVQDYAREAAYTSRDVELLSTIAAQTAVALDNARLYKALSKSEARFRALIENSSDFISLLDANGVIVYESLSSRRALGYAPEEMVGHAAFEFIHPDDLPHITEALAGLLAEPSKSICAEMRFRHKDGSWRHFEAVGHNLLADPAVGGIIVNSRDVTERKQAEVQLRLQQAALTAAANGIVIVDREGVIQWVNPAFAALTGFTAEEAAGQTPRILNSGQHSRAFYKNLWEAILAGDVWHGELINRRKDGSLYTEEMTITPVRGRGSEITHFIAIKQDVTARKRAERALQEAEAKFRTLVEQIPAITYIVDPNGQTLYVSPQIQTVLGFTPEEWVADTGLWTRQLHPEDRERVLAEDAQNEATDELLPLEYRILTKDGRVVWLHDESRWAYDESRQPRYIQGVEFDITERKQAEQELRRRAAEFAALFETSRALASPQDLKALLTTVVEQATAMLGAPSGSIMLFDAARGDLELAITKGEQRPVGTRLPLGEGMAGRVAQSLQPLIVDDYRTWEGRSPHYAGSPLSASLQVPMLYRGEVIGILDVSEVGDTTRRFTEADVHLLSLFASQAAAAVHNARLLAETRQRADELAALYATTSDLAGEHDLDALLQTITQRAMAMLKAPAGGIYLFDSTRDELELAVTIGMPIPIGARLPLGEGMAGRVAQTRRPLIVDDYHTWEGRSPHYEGLPFTAVMEVPMLSSGELIGVLAVDELRGSTRRFTEAEAQLLSLFAGQAAAAVYNARLLAETRRRVAELEAIAAVSAALRTAQTLDAMLPVLMDTVLSLIRTESGAVWLYDADRDELYTAVHRHWASDIRARPGVGMVGHVFAAGEARVARDVKSDWRPPETARAHIPEGTSAAHIPIRTAQTVIGVFSVSVHLPREIQPEEVQLLETVAEIAGNAIHRMRLHEQTQQRATQLTTLNEVARAISSLQNLEGTLEVIYEQVRRSLLLDTFIISLYDPSTQIVTYPLVYDGGRRYDEPPEPLSGTHYLHQVIRSGAPLLVSLTSEEVATHARDPKLQIGDRGRPTASLLFAPLVVGSQIIGVLSVQSYAPRAYTEEHLTLLTGFAHHTAIAVENARLFAETEHRLRQVQALHNIDVAIASSLDMHVTLNVILEQTTTQLGMDAATVLLFNPHTLTLEYTAGRGFRGKGITRLNLKLGESLAGKAALERRMVSYPRLPEGGLPFKYPELLATENFKAFYAAPLLAKGQIKGVLEVFHRAPLSPDADWVDFLETLAGQAAIAIDNATLFDGLQRSNVELSLAYDATIEGWSRALDLRDKETEGHTRRVTEMTLQLSQAMGLSEGELVHVRRGALLHDIGKMGVPDAILLKPGRLTDEEWAIMRKHPVYAYEMLLPITYLRPALDIPHCHHEKWDGTGYPRGLKGEQIPLAARVFAIVDVWDALCSDRPYRPAWPVEKVREHVRALSGTHFDPRVVEAFLRMVGEAATDG